MAGPRRRPSQPYQYILTEKTPNMPPVAYVGEGEGRHMDVEETLRMMADSIEKMREAAVLKPGQLPPMDEASISQYEKKFERAKRWGGWIWGVVAISSAIFSAGIAYAIFMGENTTDSEMKAADEAAIIDHNGDIDPQSIDTESHRPVGHHPDMRRAIESNTSAIKSIEEDILPPIVETQKKLDKRSEYQYELSRWESRVNEARRKRRKPPSKPPRLEELESDIALGKY